CSGVRSMSSKRPAMRETGKMRLGVRIVAACLLVCASCSSQNDRGEDAGKVYAQQSGLVSPDQCVQGVSYDDNALAAQGYRIQPGDQLAVDFYLNPEFNDSVSVQPDGKIVLRLVGPLQASGLTPGQLS